MGILIILGVALFALGIVCCIWFEKMLPILISALGAALLVTAFSCKFVPSGYVGIRTAYGQISEKPVSSGLNWHNPIVEKIHLVNCKQQEVDFGQIQIWSETSERTEVYCQYVVVDYQINAEYAAWIWTNVEEWDTNLVKQTSIESGIKAATKQYNDTDVTDRSKIEATAKECVQKALNEKDGNQIVNVVSVTIGNINFSDAYNAAIEKKAQAKLAAEAEQYENQKATALAEAQAEQAKITAEGEAEARRIRAQGEADAMLISAEAEANANKQIAASLTQELIELEKIQHWDGKLPTIQGGSLPLINFDGLTTD